MVSPSQYGVTYTAVSQGQHRLHVEVSGTEIHGSPFNVTVYADPRQLSHPVRTVTGLSKPYGIACNSHQEMIVSEWGGHRLSIFDSRGQKIRTFGSCGDSPKEMNQPAGVATDNSDNIYVSSEHKLQKFSCSGELIKCVGKEGSKEREFNDPRGVTVYDSQVYVCDFNNHRIQVFDLVLNFVRSIASHGKGETEFNEPLDVKFDAFGNMYVAEFCNKRVLVVDCNGEDLYSFGQKGEVKLSGPSGLEIADRYVYVSDLSADCIVVYETSGRFVTSIGRRWKREKFCGPRCITSTANGSIHVCDSWNNKVLTF